MTHPLLGRSSVPLAVLATLVLGACDAGRRTPSPEAVASVSVAPRPLAAKDLGDPIPGLTAAELAAFQRGKVIFEKRFTPAEGLGPHYNATSCASCHSTPTTGGSAQHYRNFYIAMYGNPPFQGTVAGLPSPVVPAFGAHDPSGATEFKLDGGRFVIPDRYFGVPMAVAQRNSIPVFGTGLFEFVSNATILANADPFDQDGDGISGKANHDFGDVGRFGVKAQSNNIERFTRPPLRNQMGITSDPFLGAAGTITLSATFQGTVTPNDPLTDADAIPDPEISRADLGDLIAFTRFLAPPQRLPFTPAARHGEQVFAQIGCTSCHIPSLDSSRGPVEAYTDLLLHDMGPVLSDNLQFGFPQVGGFSTGDEFRTQPLWGVSLHAPFLHDGRAETLFDAINLHGGEAQASRDAFVALSANDQQTVIEFLEHL